MAFDVVQWLGSFPHDSVVLILDARKTIAVFTKHNFFNVKKIVFIARVLMKKTKPKKYIIIQVYRSDK